MTRKPNVVGHIVFTIASTTHAISIPAYPSSHYVKAMHWACRPLYDTYLSYSSVSVVKCNVRGVYIIVGFGKLFHSSPLIVHTSRMSERTCGCVQRRHCACLVRVH
jgi:hypothetical protein